MASETKIYIISEKQFNQLEGVLREFEHILLDIFSNRELTFNDYGIKTRAVEDWSLKLGD